MPPGKTSSTAICGVPPFPSTFVPARGDSPPARVCDRHPCTPAPIHGDGSGNASHPTRTHDHKTVKCGVPSLRKEKGKPFNEPSNKPDQELGSREGAKDRSAVRQPAEEQTPDAGMQLACSPGSADAEASVPTLNEQREHAGGLTGAPNLERDSREGAMDTPAARQPAENQIPDVSVPSAHSSRLRRCRGISTYA